MATNSKVKTKMEEPKEKEEAPPVAANKTAKPKYIASHGRRKQAVARVRLFTGKGETIVNDLPIDKYFPSEVEKQEYQKPFSLIKNGQYYATIKVSGSGKSSQLGAVIHGLSRALIIAQADTRPIFKRAGLLTRDPRKKERRKYGLAQKARKGKQSPKR